MFRRLRIGLTLLYLFAAVVLIGLLGVGTYRLVDGYLQGSTDLALQHKMAEEFRSLGVSVPPELAAADRHWFESKGRTSAPVATTNDTASESPSEDGSEGDGHPGETEGAQQQTIEDHFDGELAAIYVLPLNSGGDLVQLANYQTPDISANKAAVTSAVQNGSDWRTVSLAGGEGIRLLTYRLPAGGSGNVPAVLQMGRPLGDQERVLSQLLLGLLTLGGVSALVLVAASWWLAGRSLKPAQQAWERQQAFVANASHELRAPLTLMRASTEVAFRSTHARDREQRELLGDVLHECDHMNRLVEDLLLLSRLDAGRLAVGRTVVSLDETLGDVQRQVGRLAEERGVSLSASTAPDAGAVLADPTRLRQVLIILLDNALRHTPAGGSIQVSSRRHGRHVEIVVADTGEGIPAEHLPHIFERFYRADQSPSATGGSGLGLSIARGLMEAQHGHISVASKPGHGTTVTLSLAAA